jgi:hypothetical protein
LERSWSLQNTIVRHVVDCEGFLKGAAIVDPKLPSTDMLIGGKRCDSDASGTR